MSRCGMRTSMSRKGDCWDNAPPESLRGSLQAGCLSGKRFATQREVMDEIIDLADFATTAGSTARRATISVPMNIGENWHAGQAKKAA